MNNDKYSYTYDGNNSQIEALQQTWGVSAWVNQGKDSYTYDGNNNRTEQLHQTWVVSTWVNYFRWSYTYDGNNNPIEELTQNWDGSTWVNSGKDSYTYDGNNNQIEWLQQFWDGSAWLNTSKIIYSYIITDIEEFEGAVNTYSLSNNYPNPFNPSTKISWQSPVGSNQTLKIYDLLGNEVATLVDEFKPAGSYEVKFDASGLTSGIYFYRLQVSDPESSSGQGFVETKKMLLLK